MSHRLRDAFQTEEYAKIMERHGYHSSMEGKTYVFHKQTMFGKIVHCSYPLDPVKPKGSFVDIDNCLSPIEGFKTKFGYLTLVDLQRSEDEIMKSFRKHTRNAIGAGERRGVRVEIGTQESDFEKFWQILKFEAKRKGFAASANKSDLHECWLSKVFSTLFKVCVEDKVVGGFFVVHSDEKVRFHCGTSLREYSWYKPNNVAHWQIIQHFKQEGLALYDLGRHMGSPFKKGWGKVVTVYDCWKGNPFLVSLIQTYRRMKVLRRKML